MAYERTNGVTEAERMLDECKKHLQEGNIFSSISALQEVLNLFININDTPQNEKLKLANDINKFQQALSTSQAFNELYGKVSFRENDFSTSYEFIGQLIKIKEDEINNVLVREKENPLLNLNHLSQEDRQTTKQMISLVERGEFYALRELVATHDELGSLVLSFYNETGIRQRKSGNFDKAIDRYKKALSVSPSDEHLYYNLARAYMEFGQNKNAEASILQAMQLNPRFQEGLKLQEYIRQWSN